MTNSQAPMMEPEVAGLLTKEEVQQHLGSNVAADEYLQRLIDDADQAVVSRYGPHSIDGPLTDVLRGGSVRLFPRQAVEGITSVIETLGDVATTLSPNDYRMWYGGRMLERLSNGSHPRADWGERVELEYTPVDTDPQRKMAIIRLVQLGLQYSGLKSESVGPYSAQNLDYTREREAILKQLSTGVPI